MMQSIDVCLLAVFGRRNKRTIVNYDGIGRVKTLNVLPAGLDVGAAIEAIAALIFAMLVHCVVLGDARSRVSYEEAVRTIVETVDVGHGLVLVEMF